MTSQTTQTETPAGGTAQPGALPPRGNGRLARRRKFTPQSPAGEVVLAYLDAQASRLGVLGLAVHRDKPDAVHQMRVTVRRLRAALQSCTAILPKSATQQLQAELKWLGGVLGDARDVEVLADQLHAALAAVPAELVLGPAQARVTAHFAGPEADTRAAVLEALDSTRYRELLAQLGQLLDNPPLSREAAEPAGKVLPRVVGRAYKRTGHRMRRARQAPAGPKRDVALHETRKAAKRVRYAAELAEPALGKKTGQRARRFTRAVKEVQSALGGHQDAVIARAAAREIGLQAHLAGENAFSFGLLQERAHQQALACQQQARRAWRRAQRKSRGFPLKP